MQSLSFQPHNLVVDYISFKFQELDNPTQTKIANYLFKIGFNSYKESGRLAKPVKEPIKVNFNNKFEVLFVGEGHYTSLFWTQRYNFLQSYQTRISFLDNLFFSSS